MKSIFKSMALSLAMLIFCLSFWGKSQVIYAAEDNAIVVPDLSNSDFGEVTEIVAPDSIPDINSFFEIGFGFHIFDAKSFPEGEFTYRFPDSLDFSKVAGSQIPVLREEEQIGYAVIDGENVITFKLNPEDFLEDPNGVDGNIAITCKLGDDIADDATEAEIRFSDTQTFRIVIEEPQESEEEHVPEPEQPITPEVEPVEADPPSFSAELSKESVGGGNGAVRDPETGLVNWKITLTVTGEGSGYELVLKDTIAASNAGGDGLAWLGGKQIAAEIVNGSVQVYSPDGEVFGDVATTYNKNKFTSKLTNLSNGVYTLEYSTKDYYGSRDNHIYPEGSTISFNNTIKSGTKGIDASATSSYKITTEGLPMNKVASAGRYDPELRLYVIPWTIYLNRNAYNQSISSLASGSEVTVTDTLPDNLRYREGSAVIGESGGGRSSQDPLVEGNTLTWNFAWNTNGYYAIGYDTYIEPEYYESLISNSSSGILSLNFYNQASATVGGSTGKAGKTSSDKARILAKSAAYNERTQRVDYTIVVNDKAMMLNDGNDLTLTDVVTNGAFVTGSLSIKDSKTGEVIELGEDKIIFSDQRTKLTAIVPDGRALTVKYSVAPDTRTGTDIGSGKVSVEVKNSASLIGKTRTNASTGGKYKMNKVSANVSSKSGSITITKTDKDNSENKLPGAEIALYRVDTESNEASLVDKKTTSDPLGFVKFSKDGNYKSLIFDTLYYYQEVKAPEGFATDSTKHYFIFASNRYESIKEKVTAIVAGGELKVIDVRSEGSEFETELQNEKVVVRVEEPTEEPQEVPQEPAKDPEEEPKKEPQKQPEVEPVKDPTPSDNTPGNTPANNTPGNDVPSDETPSNESHSYDAPSNSPSDSSSSSVSVVAPARNVITISPSDLPEVLGASLDDLPEVLGARRSETGDDSSAGIAIAMIVISLMIICLAMKKDNKTKR